MGHEVLISYSSKDKLTADAACAVLESKGIRCWIAPRDILPGEDWGQSIIAAINGCQVMVLIFSSHANQSQQVKREVEAAVHRGLPLIPMRIEDVLPANALEYFLGTHHWLDAFAPPLERHLLHLAATINQILNRPDPPSPEPPPPPPRSFWRRRLTWAAATVVGVLILWAIFSWRPASTDKQRNSPPPAGAVIPPPHDVARDGGTQPDSAPGQPSPAPAESVTQAKPPKEEEGGVKASPGKDGGETAEKFKFQMFAFTAGRFTVDMPGEPKETIDRAGTDEEGHTFTVALPDGKVFLVAQVLMGFDTDPKNAQFVLDVYREGYRPGAKFEEEKEITLKKYGLSGREYFLESQKGRFVRERLFLLGDRIYILHVVSGDKDFLVSKDAEHFFASFQITR